MTHERSFFLKRGRGVLWCREVCLRSGGADGISLVERFEVVGYRSIKWEQGRRLLFIPVDKAWKP